MMTLASCFLLLFAVMLAIPTSVFAIETLAAVFLAKGSALPDEEYYLERGPLAVLVPAHNESTNLLPTLRDINDQLRPGDRLVVVADNCSDDTAAIAASCGAEVTLRSDPRRIGKGYALDWGIRYLTEKPPQTVIVIDADCRISPDALETLAALSKKTARPTQALYLMTAPAETKINYQVAEFAWRLKNWVRPLGLQDLGLPCQLVGSGMAFPWELISSAELSTKAIVEDLKLGLDLAAKGRAPLFCPSAVISSVFPRTTAGANAQRQRWEHGHIGLIMTRALPLLLHGLRQDQRASLALALDLLVPPLSLLIIFSIVITSGSWALVIAGGSKLAFIISLSALALVSIATTAAWTKFAREILPLRSIGLIPIYLFARLKQYLASAFGRKVSQWVRADRT